MTKVLSSLLVTLLLVVAAAGRSGAADPPGQISLTRDAAVIMAVRNNLDLRVEALNAKIAATGRARSRALYDPQLDASSRYGDTSYPGEDFGTTSSVTSLSLSQRLPSGGSLSANTQTGYTSAENPASGLAPKDWLSSVGVSLSQPLLKNAGRDATELTISLAASSEQQSLQRFRFFITDTVFSVITGYNRLHVLRQVYQAREAALDSAVALRKQLTGKSEAGRLQAMELANADYAISQRRKDLINAGKNVRDQEATLRYLLGLEDKLEIIPVDAPSRVEPPESEAEALRAAVESRSDLKQLRLQLASQQLQERVARRNRLPDLTATASAGFSGIGGVIGDSYSQIGDAKGGWWSGGLYLSLPLGNTAAENDYLQSRIRTEQLQQRIKSYEWQIRNAVEADMRSLISARLQMRSADQSLTYAEQRLAEYRKHVGDRSSSVQDLLNAENDLIAARNAQLEAVDSFAYAVTLLWRNIGVLLDHQHVRIDTSDPDRLTGGDAPLPTDSAAAVAAAARELSRSPGGGRPSAPAAPEPAVATAAPPAGGSYTLKIGVFVTEAQLLAASDKVRAAGLDPQVQAGPKTQKPMIRLLLGGYPDQETAREGLARLRKAYADGFLLGSRKDGYSVYAGSYFSSRGAQQEQRRLAALGVEVSLVETQVPVPTRLLTTGRFSSREQALQPQARLRQQGLQPELMELDR